MCGADLEYKQKDSLASKLKNVYKKKWVEITMTREMQSWNCSLWDYSCHLCQTFRFNSNRKIFGFIRALSGSHQLFFQAITISWLPSYSLMLGYNFPFIFNEQLVSFIFCWNQVQWHRGLQEGPGLYARYGCLNELLPHLPLNDESHHWKTVLLSLYYYNHESTSQLLGLTAQPRKSPRPMAKPCYSLKFSV